MPRFAKLLYSLFGHSKERSISTNSSNNPSHDTANRDSTSRLDDNVQNDALLSSAMVSLTLSPTPPDGGLSAASTSKDSDATIILNSRLVVEQQVDQHSLSSVVDEVDATTTTDSSSLIDNKDRNIIDIKNGNNDDNENHDISDNGNSSIKRRPRHRHRHKKLRVHDETMTISTTSSSSESSNPIGDFLETMNGGIHMYTALNNGMLRPIIFKVTSDRIAWGPPKSQRMLSIQLSDISTAVTGLPEAMNRNPEFEEFYTNFHDKSFHIIPKNSSKIATFITESRGERKALVDGINLVLFAVKNGGLL